MAINLELPPPGEYKERNGRKARVGPNRCASLDGPGKEWAVFKHTLYRGVWYYDGYDAYPTKREAERARDEWLLYGSEGTSARNTVSRAAIQARSLPQVQQEGHR